MPLILEVMILATLAYLLGLGAGWVLFGRPERTSYLNDD
jgi:hypothetical protein